jgi:6-phosphofructokinase 1
MENLVEVVVFAGVVGYAVCLARESIADRERLREVLEDAVCPPPERLKRIASKGDVLTKDLSLQGLVMDSGDCIPDMRIHELASLGAVFPSANVSNEKRRGVMQGDTAGCKSRHIGYNKIIGTRDYIVSDIVRKEGDQSASECWVRAGPRGTIHFEPSTVNAAVVTCGGLCPGLNNVVRELVHALYYLYGVNSVLGVVGGYNGFNGDYAPIPLTPALVATCHHEGGSILASSRGGFDLDKIIAFLQERNIQQLFIIGGDGTHRGAFAISQEVIKRGLNIAVAGIPKTIDNDVDLIDRSFGFQTSVEAAQTAIRSAKTEAKCNLPNGIGIVKLMGRSAGFIAAHATLASGDVDLCLIPEVPIQLHGHNGYLEFLLSRVKKQGHAVVVVAEGAGEELLGESVEVDAGGNRKLPRIGEFLKSEVEKSFKANNLTATVKYIDPSYMIRSVPANANDSLYCMMLAQNAVHGTMAGYTAFTTGLVNNRVAYIPIPRLVATSPRVMDPNGRTWERVRAMTRQPQVARYIDVTGINVACKSIV